MSLLDIKLHKPRTIAEALRLFGEMEGARFLAGGTDLLVDIKQGLVDAENLISLRHIEDLNGIKKIRGRINIGALVTPREIISSDLVCSFVPSLADAARSMASEHIRSMATIGGNIVSAVPSADLPPALIASQAVVRMDCGKSRETKLSDFFLGPRKTVCEQGEILTSVLIPILPAQSGVSYQKLGLREANALAVVGVAARLTLDQGRIKKAAIVLGAVAPTPEMATSASEMLIGKTPSDSLFREAALLARGEGKPISDIRGSVWYRKNMIQILTRRALDEALVRAQSRKEGGD
jgi:carbon-monoxide dehydrogenase medium subunit